MDIQEYLEEIGVPLMTELRFYDSEKGEYINYSLMGMMADFRDKLVKESDSLPCVNDSHFTEFCCYLTGHDEKTVIQMYEDWKRYR